MERDYVRTGATPDDSTTLLTRSAATAAILELLTADP